MFTRLLKIHQNLRISSKIFIMSFLLVECIILILGFTYHRHSSASLMNMQTNYANQLLQKSDEYLQLHFNNIQSFFLSIANDNRFQSNNYEEIEKWLKENLIYFMPNTHHIHLIQNSEVVASTSLYNWSLIESDYFLGQLENMTTPMQIYWIGPYHSPVSQHTITAAIEIPSHTGQPVVLALDLDLNRLYQALNPNRSLTLQGDLLLLDRKNEAIYGSKDYVFHDVFQRKSVLINLDPAIFDRGWAYTELKLDSGKELFLTRSRSNLMGWQIIWIINKTELLKPLQASLKITWLLAIFSIFLSIGIAYVISLIISRPIRKITSKMDEVSTGNFDVAIHINRKDELGILAKHFNRMTADIKNLIANLTITEAKKKQADFTALQAQIRPHFLFNTLNTISVVARNGQLDRVDQLISSLTDQLQYNLDTSPKPATLREELKALESYFQLMTTRYQNQFSLETDIAPSTLEYVIPKFILQPIIENSIFHGLVPKEGNGTLFLGTSIEAKGWEILIEDNGVGMSPEKTNELIKSMNTEPLEDDHTFSGIGLRNVHQRLQFMFGKQYQIQISSKENVGTRILLRLPFIQKDGDVN